MLVLTQAGSDRNKNIHPHLATTIALYQFKRVFNLPITDENQKKQCDSPSITQSVVTGSHMFITLKNTLDYNEHFIQCLHNKYNQQLPNAGTPQVEGLRAKSGDFLPACLPSPCQEQDTCPGLDLLKSALRHRQALT